MYLGSGALRVTAWYLSHGEDRSLLGVYVFEPPAAPSRKVGFCSSDLGVTIEARQSKTKYLFTITDLVPDSCGICSNTPHRNKNVFIIKMKFYKKNIHLIFKNAKKCQHQNVFENILHNQNYVVSCSSNISFQIIGIHVELVPPLLQ